MSATGKQMIADSCRICGNTELLPVLDLGSQAVTSVFPRTRGIVPVVPLELVKCSQGGCGLVQLLHTTDSSLMYGHGGYGYRSSIRPYMFNHLHGIVGQVTDLVELKAGDLVVDIGSNDSTLLRGYPVNGPELVGFDPNGEQFRDLYPDHVGLVADYFTGKAFADRYGDRKAKVVTSIAMFYDLPRPVEFMQEIHDILDEDGLWISEQAYLPSMLDMVAYDAICHEHLEYYALRQFEWMAEKVGFTVVKAEMTEVHGGSIRVTMAKNSGHYKVDEAGLAAFRRGEEAVGLHTMAPYEKFAARTNAHRDELRDFLDASRAAGKLTLGYGASTKGNVILQYCGLTEKDLPAIGEVNADKAGCFTPGSEIPIVSEEDAKAQKPDQLLVLPWGYRDSFIEREHEYLANGGTLVFPLPQLEIKSS